MSLLGADCVNIIHAFILKGHTGAMDELCGSY